MNSTPDARLILVFLFTFYVSHFMSFASEVVIKATRVSAVTLDPNDPLWQKTQAATIPLSPQNMVYPHGGGSVAFLELRVVYSGEELALLFAWKDQTKNAQWDVSNRFGDACAVEFPMKSGPLPSPFMGGKERPVNIWRWSAIAQESERYPKAYADFHRLDAIETTAPFSAKPAENLAAEGFGTLRRQKEQDIEARGEWKDGVWKIVFKRKLVSKSGAVFRENAVFPVAFAVWDGANKERDGMKSVGFWQRLVLGQAKAPDPSTPVERGKIVFARYGCATCHGPEGIGGVKNSNSQGGQIPPINRVAEGFTEDELEKVIREGRTPQPADAKGPFPPLRMNAWKSVMDEEEIDDLIKYLFSLLPKDKKEEW